MYDKRSDQLAGMSVVELRHSEKRMLELAVFADEPGIDRLELPLVVDAACPAVCTNIDTGCRRLKRLCYNAALSLVVGMYLPWYGCMRLQKCLRALRVERSVKFSELVELYYTVTDVRSDDKARQGISEAAFV
jgi:hypothetical protein